MSAAVLRPEPATPGALIFRDAGLPGCYDIALRAGEDARGRFAKTFHAPSFAAAGLATDFVEAFHTMSRRGVLRGMHLQLPPHAHAKLVSCVAGEVFDVLLDLRVGSPSYGAHRVFELRDDEPRAIYVAPGVAHGFYAVSDRAVVTYMVTTVHAPAHDAGVRWDSIGVQWPGAEPALSPRDRDLPAFADFESPFRFERVPRNDVG